MTEYIVVLLPLQASHRRMLEESIPKASFTYCYGQPIPKEALQNATIIIGNLPIQLLPKASNLKWLQLGYSDAEEYIESGLLPPNVLLTTANDACALAISEHMLAMLLMLMKRLDLYSLNQLQHKWYDWGSVPSIYGSSILVIGMESIGHQFAYRMYSLGAHVSAIYQNGFTEKVEYIDTVGSLDSLDQMLPQADIVAVCLPRSHTFDNLFSKERFAQMKSNAFFMNVGNGLCIDTNALCNALIDGAIGGACIDAVDPEPLPETHPLWDAPRLIITPHISTGYRTAEVLQSVLEICAANLQAYVNRKNMFNVVQHCDGCLINTRRGSTTVFKAGTDNHGLFQP